MKRKLSDRDVPDSDSDLDFNGEVITLDKFPSAASHNFDGLGLDAQLLLAIARQKFASPTPVQSKVIPLALKGKDVVARSRTGTGKTAAYVLPVLQAVISANRSAVKANRATRALVIVPTRELAKQVTRAIQALSYYCGQDVRVENIARKEDESVQHARLLDSPDIVVATPARTAVALSSSRLKLGSLSNLVIDEADLVLSYGNEEDLKIISHALPQGVQAIMMSATISSQVDTLMKLFCHEPAILELDESEKDTGKVTQYAVRCAEDEKFLLIYAIFKLKLIQGKCIIFVDGIDRCYRLKLFLEQFGVRSCVLNSELPVNSRIHVVDDFNASAYDIIIATDELEVIGNEKSRKKKRKLKNKEAEGGSTISQNGAQDGEVESAFILADSETSQKRRGAPQRDKEYGISRGIDFKNVACVLNFDLPTTSKSYTHRIGRTGRAGNSGIALSFVVPRALFQKHKPTSIPGCQRDEAVLEEIHASQQKLNRTIEPYNFNLDKLAGFRYRMVDALHAVTKLAVREARARELRQEILTSEKLKRHFEENPAHLLHLRHDGELRAARIQQHLRHIPDYLLPGGPRDTIAARTTKLGEKANDHVTMRNKKPPGSKPAKIKSGSSGRRTDPLKTFKVKTKPTGK